MTDSLNFESLQRTWQENPDRPLPDLESMIRSRTQWIWVLTAIDGVATVGIAAFVYWLLSNTPTTFEYIFSAILVGFTVMAWLLVLRIRRGTWRLDSNAPQVMLDLLIRRCRASIKLAKINLICIVLGFVFGFSFRFWLKPELDIPALDFEEPVRFLVRLALLVVAGGWAFSAEWYRRRKTRELERLLAMREEFRKDA